MKRFEEKWTAWLDDQLTGRELADFEASLPDRAAAETEKRDAKKLGALLRSELHASTFANEEFFSHELSKRIARDSASPGSSPRGWGSWWSVPRLVFAGAGAVLLFLVFSITFVRDKEPESPSPYLTQILKMQVDPGVSPDATVSMFESKEDRVTVIWTEGLRTLPSEYASK